MITAIHREEPCLVAADATIRRCTGYEDQHRHDRQDALGEGCIMVDILVLCFFLGISLASMDYVCV